MADYRSVKETARETVLNTPYQRRAPAQTVPLLKKRRLSLYGLAFKLLQSLLTTETSASTTAPAMTPAMALSKVGINQVIPPILWLTLSIQ